MVAKSYSVEAIGCVRSQRAEPLDDDWDNVVSTIELDADLFKEEALLGLGSFSHIDILFLFDRVLPEDVQTGSRRPRGRVDWPKVGIFAQRGKNRPNRIGSTTCRLIAVNGMRLTVEGLDAIDGTPILDIKPVMLGFEPRGEIFEPQWSKEIMAGYWRLDKASS